MTLSSQSHDQLHDLLLRRSCPVYPQFIERRGLFPALARLKTGYMLTAGPKQIPILQVVPLPRSLSVAPSVGEEVVIEKSKPKDLKASEETTSLGCIVDSETEDDSMVTTTLSSRSPPLSLVGHPTLSSRSPPL